MYVILYRYDRDIYKAKIDYGVVRVGETKMSREYLWRNLLEKYTFKTDKETVG